MALASVSDLDAEFDVCIVGAGPAGLACGIACHEQGLSVLILEAGGRSPTPGEPDILAADILDPRFHDPIDIVAAPAIGGSTHWWGGRCVPLDPVDFSTWPIKRETVDPWYTKAAAFLGASDEFDVPGPERFRNIPGFKSDGFETQGKQFNMERRWAEKIYGAEGPAILTDARVTELREANGKAEITVRVGDSTKTIKARQIVLACGGLGGVRLMLMAQQRQPSLFGGPNGQLGRGYMGHLTGAICDLTGVSAEDASAYSRQAYGEGTRNRRIQPSKETIEETGVPNVAFYTTNPDFNDASHGSAVVSARFLAARLVRRLAGGKSTGDVNIKGHIDNVVRQPIAAITGLTYALTRLLEARTTGHHRYQTRLMPTRGGWRVAYHAEQRRHESNRISLSDKTDSLGLPKLKIDFKFTDEDIAGIVRAHEVLSEKLVAAGFEPLKWCVEDRFASVKASARDGYHQMGGAVMGRDPATSVVDTDLRVHGFSNLWVASSSVFPSGGQANPTLTIVALSLRLAETLGRQAADQAVLAATSGPASPHKRTADSTLGH